MDVAQSPHCLKDSIPNTSLFSRFLCIAAHNLDLLSLDVVLIVKLEINILDEECPDFVAEAVGIQMTLYTPRSVAIAGQSVRRHYLEVHARLDFVC